MYEFFFTIDDRPIVNPNVRTFGEFFFVSVSVNIKGCKNTNHAKFSIKILLKFNLIKIIFTFLINMGNNISTSIIPPPMSLSDTLINGKLDLMRYYMHKRN